MPRDWRKIKLYLRRFFLFNFFKLCNKGGAKAQIVLKSVFKLNCAYRLPTRWDFLKAFSRGTCEIFPLWFNQARGFSHGGVAGGGAGGGGGGFPRNELGHLHLSSSGSEHKHNSWILLSAQFHPWLNIRMKKISTTVRI